MKYFLLACCLIFSTFSQAASTDKYMMLIQQALDKQPPLCLGETQWPVSMNKGGSMWVNAQMEALVDAGLAKSQWISNQKIWQLTTKGQTEFNKHGDFCYGRVRINKIENIIDDGNGKTSVIFYYYIDKLPLWAKHKSIRVAHTDLDNLVTGVNNARYQADFMTIPAGSIKVIGEPYQLDLFY
ncbi:MULTISPECIES: CpmK protein [Providencia]|uniref:CpmK protein n=1 Tax=Providencia TaxID=586 RepID=UPI00141A4E18|nr:MULTISPECIES: CpmK protein [Providencia]EJD6611950.1 CpmK protein [Providencia rettgeri]ELL9148069.1 CpmK protein [Providencia rettgeri]ELR5146133.1 CpmK protein [Providencia rettgeri]ELT5686449.1 CpmK protein [Providencia rettgeri]NIA43545.1 CpmK protein [Providencia rettgeri]